MATCSKFHIFAFQFGLMEMQYKATSYQVHLSQFGFHLVIVIRILSFPGAFNIKTYFPILSAAGDGVLQPRMCIFVHAITGFFAI